MTNAVQRAIKAADLEMDDSTIVDWCNERDCFVERGFIWIKNAQMMRFENCLHEILKVSYGMDMKKQFNSDGYFLIFLAGSSPDTVLANHYTNREGYEGILASKSLRISRATPELPLKMGNGVYFTRLSPETKSEKILRKKYSPNSIARRNLGID